MITSDSTKLCSEIIFKSKTQIQEFSMKVFSDHIFSDMGLISQYKPRLNLRMSRFMTPFVTAENSAVNITEGHTGKRGINRKSVSNPHGHLFDCEINALRAIFRKSTLIIPHRASRKRLTELFHFHFSKISK